MASSSPPRRSRRWWLGGAVGLVLLIGAGGAVWWLICKPRPDMAQVIQANNRGIGYIEQFNFPEAVHWFEVVVHLAPDWLPGRINLGIGLLNLAKDPKALPEAERAEVSRRATELFQDVLRQDANNPYAHFCLGLLLNFEGNPDYFPQAREHFLAVTRIDDRDPGAWYWAGYLTEDAAEAAGHYRRALELDPYLNSARYGLHGKLMQQGKEDEARAVIKEWDDLKQTEVWSNEGDPKYYTELGRYALVIGQVERLPSARKAPLPLFVKDEKLNVQLAPGTVWATSASGGTRPVDVLRGAARDRFGAVAVVLDYNRDGKPDLFLVAAVFRDKQVRNLLLRNDGDGRFTDVTGDAGLGAAEAGLGCCAADFDNDGFPDLFVTGAGEQHLYRNTGKGTFEDVTAKAGLDGLTTVCLGAAFVDLDQDGDLDLVVAQYADTAVHAVAALRGEVVAGAPGLAVFLNVGEAKPALPSDDPPPLTVKFRRLEKPAELLGDPLPTTALAVTDLDLDLDLDLVVFADRKAPALVLNDRLLRFHRPAPSASIREAENWNGAVVLDVNQDERSDLLLVGPGRGPALLLHQPGTSEPDVAKWFKPGIVNSPALLQAHAVDVDFDGDTDVIGLSVQRKPVLLHNQGGKLVHVPNALGLDADWPNDVVAVSVADFNCDGLPDVMVWSEASGPQVLLNKGNGNHGLKVELTGHRRVDAQHGGKLVRCNTDGFGTRIIAQAVDLHSGGEFTTLSAGLGQSRQPFFLGLGRHNEPDVLRLRWPDNVWQAEFTLSPAECRVVRIEEINRKQTSCPILFTWDGQRYAFVTDFLGAGSVGESQPEGGHRPPRPEESVKIEAEQLVPRDGQYVLKIAEPMDEVTYLDRLQLVVLDQPPGVRVYPDERFAAGGPPPTQALLAFKEEIYSVRARDHRGRDLTQTLRAWDRATADGFLRRTWIGFAEEHAVELDFGDRLAKFGDTDRLVLCLAGWTDYPYPESIWAAAQAGVPLQPPVLERRDADGTWHAVAEAGFPAGLPRMMTLDVTGKLGGGPCVLRLRTNMQVFWDQVFVAPVLEAVAPHPQPLSPEYRGEGGRFFPPSPPLRGRGAGGEGASSVRTTTLEVGTATLAARGCMKEYSPDGRQPTLYDYDRLEAVPVARLAGRLTRFGDVAELLRDTDDRSALFGPGDELDVRFDARRLPELPAGWTRSFVLRTWGWCKDCAPFTDSGATVEPLPFRAMRDYPYGPEQKYPHEDTRRRFHTRQVGPNHPSPAGRR